MVKLSPSSSSFLIYSLLLFFILSFLCVLMCCHERLALVCVLCCCFAIWDLRGETNCVKIWPKKGSFLAADS
ncbi:Os03g0641300 [Oryza sativa Japonica Group]|uniref:Uncharacterized protein n=2 Tax=Oryza sativa subsp. japonica TaxID=39947 RepID=A0A8J8YD33_ORYSJ|nr:hypothetical protein OsJ_24110 [Oryza sativa Japonica Group]KAB8092749.1 hypothetical protein EE612_019177 [Oryza sativa]BAS85435.1 Os03g0641300 [Oryza sativa Japonica Group]